MNERTTQEVKINRIANSSSEDVLDVLAVEEPLEIRLQIGTAVPKSISITMRTPGADVSLATGFLYTEGILSATAQVKRVIQLDENIILISIADDNDIDLARLERNFYTSSSCGVCGKSSIESLRTVCPVMSEDDLHIPYSLVYSLPSLLRSQQNIFEHTGGLHASALFDKNGNLLLLNEDVGRHNALDKLIGNAFAKGMLPLNDHVLLLSGRASFELIQKAAMAGIRVVAAVGAPSSLAVQLAEETGMTLIGFLRDQRFNIYTGAKRIIL